MCDVLFKIAGDVLFKLDYDGTGSLRPAFLTTVCNISISRKKLERGLVFPSKSLANLSAMPSLI